MLLFSLLYFNNRRLNLFTFLRLLLLLLLRPLFKISSCCNLYLVLVRGIVFEIARSIASKELVSNNGSEGFLLGLDAHIEVFIESDAVNAGQVWVRGAPGADQV